MKTHKCLNYYRKHQELLNESIPKLNRILRQIEKFIDDPETFERMSDFIDADINRNKLKLSFAHLYTAEFNAVKNALNLNDLHENTDEFGHDETGEYLGVIITFHWGLPKNCDITTEYEYEETYMKPDDLKIEKDKVLRRRAKIVSINSNGESVLDDILKEREAV